MPENLKFAPLNDRAFRLWVHATCYCSRAQTDGFVPAALITSLSVSATRRTVDELVNARLLEPVEAGYLVHDYLSYNPSRVRIREMRDESGRRVAEHRERRGNAVTGADVTPLQAHDPRGRDRSVTEPDPVVALFDYWRATCGHPSAMPTDERLRKIRQRRDEGYTDDQIRAAIDGAARGAFVNDAGKRFDDIELICRNGSKLESFIDRANAKPTGAPVSELDRKRLESMNRLMGEKGAA